MVMRLMQTVKPPAWVDKTLSSGWFPSSVHDYAGVTGLLLVDD